MIVKTISICLLTFTSFLAAAQENNKLLASVSVTPIENNKVTIKGLCTNATSQNQNLSYELRLQKKGKTGNTNNNTQSGSFTLKPEESKTLSTTTINVEPEDHTEIVLTILDAENVQVAQQKKVLTKADLIKN